MERFSPFFLLAVLLLVQCLMGYGLASTTNSNINTDQSSLLALKSHITSDPYNMLSKNWTTETSVCSWIGVSCGFRYNRVTKLNISNMEIASSIPPEIGNLSFLVSLDMSGNFFHGPIPPSIFNMSSLEVLVLRNNSLSSSLPVDMCKHGLRKLKKLRIAYNKLYGEIPSSLDQCSQLEYISLYHNNFGGQVPREIGNLSRLQELYLGINSLSGLIPFTIGNLSHLDTLMLHSNKLKGEIPSSICNLRSLEFLHLSNNSLEGTIPQCLGNLSKYLQVLHLKDNYLHGLIPSIFTNGCVLESLNLNSNQFEGTLPRSLANCRLLQVLDIGNNEIQDRFPFWMESLPELRVLVLRSNKFNGTISLHSKTNVPFLNLQVLDISQNAFTGSLSNKYLNSSKAMINAKENITKGWNWYAKYDEPMIFVFKGLEQRVERILKTFTIIDMSENKFFGSISESIGKLNSLKYLNLSHNGLTGRIPLSLGNVNALESLDLSSNQLDGEIPRQLTSLTFLSTLNLSMNNLVGQIPQSPQFSTFENNSYMGNTGLCGVPLTKKCEEDNGRPTLSVLSQQGNEPDFLDGFTWQAVVLGYGSGFVIGVTMGYFILRYGRPKWLVELFFGVQYKVKRSSKENVLRRRT